MKVLSEKRTNAFTFLREFKLGKILKFHANTWPHVARMIILGHILSR